MNCATLGDTGQAPVHRKSNGCHGTFFLQRDRFRFHVAEVPESDHRSLGSANRKPMSIGAKGHSKHLDSLRYLNGLKQMARFEIPNEDLIVRVAGGEVHPIRTRGQYVHWSVMLNLP